MSLIKSTFEDSAGTRCRVGNNHQWSQCEERWRIQQVGEVAGTAVAGAADNMRLRRVRAGAGAAHVGCGRIREVGKRNDGLAGFRVRSER